MNHYELLEVPQNATLETIKDQYNHTKEFASRNRDGGKLSTQVENAYKILSDSYRRAEYDRSLGFSQQANVSLDEAKRIYTKIDVLQKEIKKTLENFPDNERSTMDFQIRSNHRITVFNNLLKKIRTNPDNIPVLKKDLEKVHTALTRLSEDITKKLKKIQLEQKSRTTIPTYVHRPQSSESMGRSNLQAGGTGHPSYVQPPGGRHSSTNYRPNNTPPHTTGSGSSTEIRRSHNEESRQDRSSSRGPRLFRRSRK